MERRLAAVLIADVAGYGRLSQADEEATRARFQADLHEVFEPAITTHRGRLVKTMGDGLLVEFPASWMPCAAVEMQRAKVERNAGLPLERRMELRIGLNLGDVIVEGDDIHGDGVPSALATEIGRSDCQCWRAIALDPSDPWAYTEMSLALALNGRAADARDYLTASSRVHPQPDSYRHLLAGLIAFCMEEFDDAVAALEKAAPQELTTDNNRRQRLYLLAAAHAHLGHMSEAAAARAELEAIRGNESGLTAMHEFAFKQQGDIERLWKGLSKAGLPDFPFGLEAKNRLTGDEIRSLVFGHELRGRQVDPDEPYVRTTTADGVAQVSIGSSMSLVFVSRIEGDFICTLWDTEAGCAAIFRNPGGTSEKQNEYVFVIPNNHLEFA